ncbi:hypothetical protein WJX84_009504 [Apatococcus fuscideae]|uniref:Uncharacterized protein n=1 Tax=Apatococcus fuscideae TaxID=2026836 RepID=A0AAW1SV51_9CHLO
MQETATTLVGMILGMLLTRVAAGAPVLATLAFCLLTLLHVVANILAMRALQLQTINPHRLKMLLHAFLKEEKVPTPAEVAEQDVLLPPAVTDWWRCMLRRPRPGLNLMLGVPLQSLRSTSLVAGLQGSARYILEVPQPGSHDCKVALRDDAEPADVLRAAVAAQITYDSLQSLKNSKVFSEQLFLSFCSKANAAGWSLNRVLLTQSQWRAAWGDRLRSGHLD